MDRKPYLREISLKSRHAIDFNAYPFRIPAVKELGSLVFHPDVTFFVGENGSGKSTVLEALALALGFGPEGGTQSNLFATADSTSPLYKNLKIVRSFSGPRQRYFLRAESFFNVASEIERLDAIPQAGPKIGPSYGVSSLHHKSHGEIFMAVLLNKLKGRGLYLFDEPEAALSPGRQLAMLSAIHQLVHKESQFIIATHSPILLSYPRSKIVHFSDSGLAEVNYEETEHYSVTRDFLNNYSRRLEQLLLDGE